MRSKAIGTDVPSWTTKIRGNQHSAKAFVGHELVALERPANPALMSGGKDVVRDDARVLAQQHEIAICGFRKTQAAIKQERTW